MQDARRGPIRTPDRVRVVQALECTQDDEDCLLPRHQRGAELQVPEPATEIVAVHVLEDHRIAALLLAEVQYPNDARVLKMREDLRLANEASRVVWSLVEVRKNAFDDHRFGEASGSFQAAEVDDPHTALRQSAH